MTDAPLFAEPPDSALLPLPMAPRLASWNRAGDSDQIRLAEYLKATAALLQKGCGKDTLRGALALRLEVGLPCSVDVLAEHDLDNYAFPLVSWLTQATNCRFVSVWCRKRHSPSSYIAVVPATPGALSPFDQSLVVVTTASASTTAFKEQIADQVKTADPLPAGPVSLHLGFCVGPSRNWANLWKPTIDSLDQLLGRTQPDRQWHPLNGRITELGLHCRVEPNVGSTVSISIKASTGALADTAVRAAH